MTREELLEEHRAVLQEYFDLSLEMTRAMPEGDAIDDTIQILILKTRQQNREIKAGLDQLKTIKAMMSVEDAFKDIFRP